MMSNDILIAARESLEHPPDFAYFGDYHEEDGWGRAFGQHRDSDALARSNFTVISEDLLTRFPDDVHVESCNHWAVGWVETLRIRVTTQPSFITEESITDCFHAVIEWQEALESYPVADESHFSELETEEFWNYLEDEVPHIFNTNHGDDDQNMPEHLIESVYQIVSEQCFNADDLPYNYLENAIEEAWINGLIEDATALNSDQERINLD